jgi:hypothetical protein
MPQFRRRPDSPPPDPVVRRANSIGKVAKGVDVGHDHVSTKAQLDRLGKDKVRELAEALGRQPPSDRTIRRWKQHGRIPHADVAKAVERADTVGRLGGAKQAAQQVGRSPKTMDQWAKSPNREMRPDAADKLTQAATAERRAAAGIPVTDDGEVSEPGYLYAEGDVEVKGSSTSATYERERNLHSIRLDLDTTRALVEAREQGDNDAALAAVEEYLSTNYAKCDGYGDDFGWHFTALKSFEVHW